MVDSADFQKIVDGDKTVTQIAAAGAMLLLIQGLTSPALLKATSVANMEGMISNEATVIIGAGLFVAGIAAAGLTGGAAVVAAVAIGGTGL